MPQKALLPALALFAFCLSSFCDNITTTLVTMALIQSLELPARNNIKLAVLAVFSINSGGAALITGDVTTLMIFTVRQGGHQRSLRHRCARIARLSVARCLLMPGFEGTLTPQRSVSQASRFDVWVAMIFVTTIVMTLVINLFVHVPPC